MIEEPTPQKTPLSALGEFGLIQRLTEAISLKNTTSVLGVGDDAAVLDFGPDSEVVVTKDLLLEGVHFDLSYTPLKHLGYKAAAVNLSDLCAMNATPSQLLVGLAVSNRFPVEALEEIYHGLYLACDRYGVDLVGGDTTSSQTGLMLSVTAIGHAQRGTAVRRSGASATDLLVVTGDLGAAYLGLQVLEREKAAWQANPNLQPELQGHEYVLERQLKPEPRVDMIRLLRDLDVRPTSLIDVSDGLSSEVLHLCDASGLGCKLFEAKIPMDPTVIRLAEEFGINPITAALNGGEDYELLFTVPLSDWDKIKGNPNLTAIGHLTESPQRWLVLNSGQEVELKAQGFQHQ
jgi:thiamine-monophosphate kinase